MRQLHAPVFEGILIALRDIFAAGLPADKVIRTVMQANRKWGGGDRRLFAEAVYDVVRWWRRLLFTCGYEWPAEDRWTRVEPEVLRAVAGMWAVLHEVVPAKGLEINPSGPGGREGRARWEDRGIPRAVRESIPDWMDRWGEDQLGQRWDSLLATLNTVAPVYLRANRLRTSVEKLIGILHREGVEAVPVSGDAIRLVRRANVFVLPAFREGLFEVQDLSSQQVALALGPLPGERVVDACAGAGGKSLHVAALMANKGRVLAMDVLDRKLEQLRTRATRSGATCIETRTITGGKVIKRQAGQADRLLLDVPCSGLGVLRRNPDAKWRLSLDEVTRLEDLQARLLSDYPRMVRAGGTLVYATCSVAPAENERQIERFLGQNEARFHLDTQTTHWPQVDGPDGFFVAKLISR